MWVYIYIKYGCSIKLCSHLLIKLAMHIKIFKINCHANIDNLILTVL